MSYWTFNNEVGLKGVDGTIVDVSNCNPESVFIRPDPDNPARLSGDTILYALRISRTARHDFRRLFPTLLPEEQARLTALLEANPRMSMLVQDEQKFYDRIQHRDVAGTPVRTSGKRGGTLYGR
jgi:hypothetical protein